MLATFHAIDTMKKLFALNKSVVEMEALSLFMWSSQLGSWWHACLPRTDSYR